MADTQVLGTCVFGREGSSPFSRTRKLLMASQACRHGQTVTGKDKKVSLAAIKELHGMAPNAIRVLIAEMKKADLSFRK